MTVKFCKDCVHFQPLSEMCNSQWSAKGVDVIWGLHEKLSAYEMRHDGNKCGMNANFFEDANGFKKFDEGVIQ